MGPSLRVVRLLSVSLSLVLALNGCTKALIHDDVKSAQASGPIGHCAGSEWVDDSSLAVLPIPVVAFVVPHWNVQDIRADEYLKRCGDPTKLINRHVGVNHTACIPTALTRIISLGIWQWCPARVSWETDVKA